MDPNRNPGGNNDPKKGGDNKDPKSSIWLKLLIAVAAVFVISSVYNMINDSQYNQTTWSDFRAAMGSQQIVEAEIQYDRIIYLTKEEAAKPASAQKACYTGLPSGSDTMELADALNEVLSAKWRDLRGIEIVSVGVSSVKASEEDEKMIKELQRNAAFRNPQMAAAHLVGAQAAAMQAAASNEGGAAMAFMGMNMAANAGGVNAQSLYQMGMQQPVQQAAPAPAANVWTCPGCGAQASGKFCPECGTKKPAASNVWVCQCGAENKGKFCAECGSKKPAGEPLYKCDKCGWEPADPKNPPKFCPECGDSFDSSDIM